MSDSPPLSHEAVTVKLFVGLAPPFHARLVGSTGSAKSIVVEFVEQGAASSFPAASIVTTLNE